MHEHRSAHSTQTTVRGLGVCDALHVELAASQAQSLQRALEARITALEERLPSAADEHERHELDHTLCLLRGMRTNEPVLIGPAGLVLDLVQACFAEAIDTLARHLQHGAEPLARLDQHTRAAAAWIKTLSDCRAVEGYTFEPDADPSHAW
jgi:hypothetical protein